MFIADVGETVLTSPQCLARVVSLPQPDIALVLLEMIPGNSFMFMFTSTSFPFYLRIAKVFKCLSITAAIPYFNSVL